MPNETAINRPHADARAGETPGVQTVDSSPDDPHAPNQGTRRPVSAGPQVIVVALSNARRTGIDASPAQGFASPPAMRAPNQRPPYSLKKR